MQCKYGTIPNFEPCGKLYIISSVGCFLCTGREWRYGLTLYNLKNLFKNQTKNHTVRV